SPPPEIAASSVAFNSRIACLLPWHCAAPLRPGGCFLAPAPTLPPSRGRVKGVNPVHRVRARGGKDSRPERRPVAGLATGRCETGGWPHLPPNRWLATLTCSPVFPAPLPARDPTHRWRWTTSASAAHGRT